MSCVRCEIAESCNNACPFVRLSKLQKKVAEVSYRVVTGLFGQYSRRIVCQRVACSRVAGGMDSVQSQCCVYVTVPASAPETARVDIPARANGTRTANRCVCDSRFLER